MRIRDLAGNVALRGNNHDDFDEPFHEEDEDNAADNVEHDVGHGHAARSEIGAQGGEHGGDTGADIIAQEHRNGAFQRDKALTGHGNQNTDGSTTGLNEYGHHSTDEDA